MVAQFVGNATRFQHGARRMTCSVPGGGLGWSSVAVEIAALAQAFEAHAFASMRGSKRCRRRARSGQTRRDRSPRRVHPAGAGMPTTLAMASLEKEEHLRRDFAGQAAGGFCGAASQSIFWRRACAGRCAGDAWPGPARLPRARPGPTALRASLPCFRGSPAELPSNPRGPPPTRSRRPAPRSRPGWPGCCRSRRANHARGQRRPRSHGGADGEHATQRRRHPPPAGQIAGSAGAGRAVRPLLHENPMPPASAASCGCNSRRRVQVASQFGSSHEPASSCSRR